MCLGNCQPRSQVAQSRAGAELPSGASVPRCWDPGLHEQMMGRLRAWMLARLGAGQGAFSTGPRGSLRQEQPRLGGFFLGLGGCRREKMGERAEGSLSPASEEGQEARGSDWPGCRHSRSVSGQTQKRLVTTAKKDWRVGGQISASVTQALCGVHLWVPSPPALARKAVTVGTWRRGHPVLMSGYLLLLRPKVKV